MPMQKTDVIWFNGEWVPWDAAQVHVMTHALHYGSSVFEGIRAYKTERGPAIFCLDPHLDRLFFSCRVYRMDIPYPREELRTAIIDVVRRNRLDSCYLRPLVFRGVDTLALDARACPVQVIVAAIPWGRYLGQEAIEQGVDVGISSWNRMAPNTFPALAKVGGHYANSQPIAMEAKERGFAECIALDVNGYVSEGSGENIFIVRNGTLFTPPLGASVLMGITRECVITLAREAGYEVREQMIPREMLYIANEILFCGTAVEITPVRSVDGIPIGTGQRGPVTAKLQEQFFGITSGEIEDRHGWLTYV